jgi:hypothetical protein
MNNTTFKCCLDQYRLTVKPKTKGEAFDIGERIGRSIKTVDPKYLKTFAWLVGTDGRTFCPATFKEADTSDPISKDKAWQYGLRRQDNFDQMQLFVLDFNNDKANKIISFEEVKSRADEYNLPILFAYRQFASAQDSEKFTITFLNDVSIEYPKVAEIVLDALLTVFPEADRECNDISRIVFGGNKPLLYLDDSMPQININSLIRSMTLWLRNDYGDTNYKRKIVEFAKRHGLKLTSKNLIDISIVDDIQMSDTEYSTDYLENIEEIDGTLVNRSFNKNSPSNSIIYIKGNGENLLNQSYKINLDDGDVNNSHITSITQKKPKVHKLHRSDSITNIRSVCQLFRDFEKGDIELQENELSILAENLINIESGEDVFLNTLKKYNHHPLYVKRYDHWSKSLSTIKQYMTPQQGYEPTRCEAYCPHKDKCHHARDIISTAKPERRTTQKLANYATEQFYSKEIALYDLNRNLMTAINADNAVNADEPNIHVIKAPVGIGKSTAVIEYLAEHRNQICLYACSSNDLKNELHGKARNKLYDEITSTSLYDKPIIDELPSRVLNRIQRLHQAGKHHAVTDYIKEVIAKREVDMNCINVLKTYFKDLTRFYTSYCNAFTTHSRLLTMDNGGLKKYDFVIIDEDIFMNCMIPSQAEILITELEQVLEEIDSNCDLAKKIKAAVKAAKTKSWITLDSIDYINTYDDISVAVDIPSFCRATKFYLKKKTDKNNLLETNQPEDSIIFLRPLKLYPYIKYIVLSATADHRIYNYFFGAKRIKFYDCKQAELVGTLNQNTDQTMSRACIAANPGILDAISELTGNKNRITFKIHSRKEDKVYFGKTTGIDTLKGQNLDVIGTPHQPEWIYKLFAYTIGHDIEESDKLRYQLVRHDGFAHWFMTFESSLLRDIQLWMISSELIQAVGRARLTRYNCTVNVFSDFPLPQAILNEFKSIKSDTRIKE